MNTFSHFLVPGVFAWIIFCGTAFAQLETVPPSQVGLSEEKLQKLTHYLQREIDSGRVAGAVAFVARHGKTGYFKAFGSSNRESGRAMETDTLFRIASMTKAITTTGVMMLVEEGRIMLDDPVTDYLPEFSNPRVFAEDGDPVPASRVPTIHDLLTHTSGIGYGWFGPEAQDKAYLEADIPDILVPVDETLGDRVKRLGPLLLAFHPGESWSYGLSIDVLGRVLEVVTDLTLEQFLHERIFRPLDMNDTHFYVPDDNRDKLASLYTPDSTKENLIQVGADTVAAGPIKFSNDAHFAGRGRLFAGGSGLVSSTPDYARFLQMLLDDGRPLLREETVARMRQNQIGDLTIPFPGHGDGFGYGFGVLTQRGKANDIARVGTFSWGGIYNSYYWVDPQEEMIGVLMMQVFPNDHLETRAEFKRLAYEAINDSGFSRLYWYEKGVEQGNPFFNDRQLRVNSPEVSTHEKYSQRSEPRSSGMGRILIKEDLRHIRRADLYCEVWGGHPGTTNKRVTINGRGTYPFPEVGTTTHHCSHQYVSINLKPNDLVNGHNALQFACDQGTTFWGHYIVDNSCLKIGITDEDAGRKGFTAQVVTAQNAETDTISLKITTTNPSTIERVDYQARYFGYDENGNGYATDWHGMTKGREPYGTIGSAAKAPFSMDWSTKMLPAQSDMAVRALVRFKDDPTLIYETPVSDGLAIPPRTDQVSIHHVKDLPSPFWSRNNKRIQCSIPVHIDPATIEASELHIVTWTGGAGEVRNYFTLNGHFLDVAPGHDHQTVYSKIPIDPGILRKGDNEIVLHSDTEHHGIEVLLPGPALVIRTKKPGNAADAATSLPPGFVATTIVKDINAATSLTVAPDGRVFYAEQTGMVRVVKNDELLPRPALDISSRLDTWWERGLIGMTLHPDFPRTPFLYAVYVAKEPFTHHVISRFTVVGDTLDRESELVLLEGDDQAGLGGHVPAGHQGGPICFGKDGMLYIGLGEQTAGNPSQSLSTLQGKILRIRPDGRIPEDNPFYADAQGKYRAIYVVGIRNPFGLAVESESGRILETDVGASAFEEINDIIAGANYGWPDAEGMSDNPDFANPLHAYPPAIGRSICGAMFYPKSGNFPDSWKGKLFFADWASHWIKAIDIDQPDKLISFASGLKAPVGVVAAPDGSVYVLNRNTRWRDGKEFEENAGSLVKIRYVGDSETAAVEPSHPPTLAATGLFDKLVKQQPVKEFRPFRIHAPVWLPGVTSRRWIRMPNGGTIQISEEGPWQFPMGTTIIEHYATTKGRPHETHVFTSNGDSTFKAAAYRWDTDGSSAALVQHSEITGLNGHDSLKWLSPGAESALNPEFAIVGFVPRFNTQQLNTGNQLAEWRDRGWLDSSLTDSKIATLPRLAALEDTESSVDHRVRSYLDSNCATCHRPGGPSRGLFDARFTTPSGQQKMVWGKLMAGDMGINVPDAMVVVPGAPEKSILYQRMASHDAFRMPPIAVNNVRSPVERLVEKWIREMPTEKRPAVRLTENAVDVSAGNISAYKIETDAATYFLEKSGAGLSSLIDKDGNDWLGFHPEPGSGASGEYRGFPNAVHQQAGNYFHAKNTGTDKSATKIIHRDPDHVTIIAEGDNGKWACRYDFTPTHCTFTMTKMPDGKKYWALYEGIPGGDYNDDDWWITSAIENHRPLTKPHEGDIPAPEWIAFGDKRFKRALFLYHHEDDGHPDHYYQMQKKMTVFGFGRRGMDKFLHSVPQSVSIGLVESDAHSDIGKAVEQIIQR